MLIILGLRLRRFPASIRTFSSFWKNFPASRIKSIRFKEKAVTTEIYLLGDTLALDKEQVAALPGVERVIRISEEYRILGRHKYENRVVGFDYNGVHFGQENLNIFAGLCAVDNPRNVETMMSALKENGLSCTRMGAYKPRTNPYSFQGHGKECLPGYLNSPANTESR